MSLVRRCLAVAAFAAVLTLQAGSALAVTVSPQSVLAVAFSDASHGYLAGGYTGSNGVLAYTSDGGATWKPSQFAGRRTWAVGASADGSSATASADYYDEAVSTTNSGSTWTSLGPVFGGVPSFGGTSHINDIAYLSGGRVAVGRQDGTASNGNVAVIARESGGDWTPDFRPLYPPLEDGTPVPTYASLSSVDAAAGGTVAWAAGAEYPDQQISSVTRSLIYRTPDGGSSWVTETVTSGAVDISAVTAASADVAYATYLGAGVGSRYFLRRSSVGVWTRSEQPIALGFQANALDAFDADHLVVVGDAGKGYYTSNATAVAPTWTLFTAGANNLYGVQMLGPDSWIVVGGNETIVRFKNGVAVAPGSSSLTSPTVSITSPAPGFSLPVATIAGSASDTGVGVLKVEVQIRGDSGKYWNGLSWVAAASDSTWLPATGTTSWSYSFSPGVLAPKSAAITVRATDGMNLTGQSTVSSDDPAGVTLTPVYRFLNKKMGTHFYTASEAEYNDVNDNKKADFTYEGIAYRVSPASTTGAVPVYRFLNKKLPYVHFYTATEAEMNNVKNNDTATWGYEGVAYYVWPAKTGTQTPVWRFFKPKQAVHFYTATEAEMNNVKNTMTADYTYEGVAYYVEPYVAP